MPIFALQKIEAIKGKQEFDKLIVDDKCPFDEFEKSLEAQYKSELAGIYHYMQDVADLKTVPHAKYHFYDEGKNGVREFEFKSKHLRVYGITKPNGKIVITGGTKTNQKDDEGEFRRLKSLYLASLTTETTTKKRNDTRRIVEEPRLLDCWASDGTLSPDFDVYGEPSYE